MADCIDFNCPAFVSQTENDCGDILVGGADAAILIKCGVSVVDPSDDVEINGLITAGDAVVIKNLKVGIEAASPITIDPVVACGPAKTINYDRTGTWYDANVNAANSVMYSGIFNSRSFGGLILRECEGQVTYVDAEITFTGSRILPNNNNEAQRYEGAFAWKSPIEPTIHAEPAGIF